MIVIVGHGTSIRGSRLGSTIDAFDCPIVRFNDFLSGCRAVDRGSRVDYLCTTTLQFGRFIAAEARPTTELWVYDTNDDLSLANLYDGSLYIDSLSEWIAVYRGLRAEGSSPKFCKGLAAIIIAAKRVSINNILLFGYDNLWAGESKHFRTLGYSRGIVKETAHDYVAEKKMIDMIAKRYRVSISHEEYL